MSEINSKTVRKGSCALAALLLMLIVAASQAEVACNRAKPHSIEALTCDDSSLSQLERDLNQSFRLALQVTVNRTALQQEQLKWLRGKRNKCQSKECLHSNYGERIAKLSDIFASNVKIAENPFSDAEAQTTCRALGAMADKDDLEFIRIPGVPNSGRKADEDPLKDTGWVFTEAEQAQLQSVDMSFAEQWPNHIYKLKLSTTSEPMRFGRFYDQGTCYSESTGSIPKLLNAKGEYYGFDFDEVPDPKDEIRWTNWDGTEYPIFYRGRNFILSSSIPNQNRVNMVSWVKPDGGQRPICLLDAKETGRLKTSPHAPDVCTQIANRQLKPMKWRNISNLPAVADAKKMGDWRIFRSRYGDTAESVELLVIDLNGDGQQEHIGRFTYHSTAGCGPTETWLSILSIDNKEARSLPTNAWLKIPSSESEAVNLRRGDQVPWKAYGSVEIYEHLNQHYISIARQDHDSTLFRMTSGELNPVCKIKQVTKTLPTRYFSLEEQKHSSGAP